MIFYVLGHEFKVFDNVGWAIVTEITAAGRSHDVGGAIEDTGVCDINEDATVAAKYSGVEGLATLSVYVREKAVGRKDVVNPVGSS